LSFERPIYICRLLWPPAIPRFPFCLAFIIELLFPKTSSDGVFAAFSSRRAMSISSRCWNLYRSLFLGLHPQQNHHFGIRRLSNGE
jgi:hypothetical protein